MYGVKVLDCSVALEAGDHLAVASPVGVPPLASRLARVVDRAAAREHEAERAGLGARRHAGEHRALVPVAPHVGDNRLVEAAEGVVPGELAARPRERGVAALRELLRLVARHVVHRPRLVDRHGAVFGARVASVLGNSLKSCDAEHYRISQDRRRRGLRSGAARPQMVPLPQGGRPSPRSARRRSSSWRASCRHTTTRRRSSRRSGTTTAHSRATRGSSRPAPLNPHPRLAHAYHERFLFLEVCDARQLQRRQARQTHSRRDREPRRSLRQLRGIMEMNSAQNTKRTRR